MDIKVRNAVVDDRFNIAFCIAEGFEKDFSVLCKDTNKVALAIESGLAINTFYVAEADGKIAGVLAVSDCHGRAAKVDRKALKKHFGFIKGIIGCIVLKEEFEKELSYQPTTGYIEFVAVGKGYRQKGVATVLLKESIEKSKYENFVLDVTDVNSNAIKCYTKFGFKEFKREKEKNGKHKGFNERIYMQYFHE